VNLAPEHVSSPCVKLCALDPRSGYCVGCYRTIDEVANWVEMSAEDKRAVLERVARRRARQSEEAKR
jgi:predicted Fe-S protein YdhL (DUF1289 family)